MALALVACLAIAGCASNPAASPRASAASPSSSSSEASSPSPTTRATATERPSPTAPERPAPPELAGVWLRTGGAVRLTLDGTRYTIHREDHVVSGRIAVEGDRIEFFNSGLCAAAGVYGVGVYTWTIADGLLTITKVEDPCGGRSDVFRSATFAREE